MARKRPAREWAPLDLPPEAFQMRFGSSILTDPEHAPHLRAALRAHGYQTDESTHPGTLSHGERGLVALLLGFKTDGKGGWR